MRNIAVIPARSGSKGLKDKNIKDLCGKPMLAYSIIAAKESGKYDVIHVSTDSQKYADIAREWGADVPFLRTPELATDTSKSGDAIRYVLDEYAKRGEEFDTVTTLQPTSPLRIAEDINIAFDIYTEKNAKAVVSVCEAEHSPLWCNTLGDDGSMASFLSNDTVNVNRQRLSQYYRLNGAIYLVDIGFSKTVENIYQEGCYAYIMPKERSVDIDDEYDFIMAKALMENRLEGK